MDKELFRKQALANRDSLSDEVIKEASFLIQRHFIHSPAYQEAKVLMVYMHFRSEVQTDLVIEEAIKDHKTIVIPYTTKNPNRLYPAKINDFETDTELDFYGIVGPKKDNLHLIDPKSIDSIIIPGVAFDRKGYRMGYGAGYYDQFLLELKESCSKQAFAFDEQIYDHIPIEPHDQKIPVIITQKEVLPIP